MSPLCVGIATRRHESYENAVSSFCRDSEVPERELERTSTF